MNLHLIGLDCPACGSAMAGEPHDVLFFCSHCGSGALLDPEGLETVESTALLPAAIIADWAVLALAAWLAAGLFAIKAGAVQYIGTAVAVSLPGTILQVVAVPLTVPAIEKRVPRLRPTRREETG